MEGYDAATYGDRFVDVYDDWYGSITDTDACVHAVARLAGGGAVLELGVGTGRLAIPLASRGVAVTGVDASAAMLARLASKPGGHRVTTVQADMADPLPGSPRFAVVLVAYNTLFNLVEPGAQQRCLDQAAAALTDDGCLLVEAFVPDPGSAGRHAVTPRHVTADRVVLSVTSAGPTAQEVVGQYVDITETGIRLRPWHIRWSTPAQIDAMADRSGLVRHERWRNWAGEPFDDHAVTHVSMYRRAGTDPPATGQAPDPARDADRG